MAEIKFCGMTRPEDVRVAAECGARYVGVILTESKRRVDPDRAATLFEGLRDSVNRVGVFSTEHPEEIARIARVAGLDIVQLHNDPSASAVRRLRFDSGLRVWAVVRVSGGTLPPHFDDVAGTADAIVLDALVPNQLGGTGQALDWSALGPEIEARRGRTPIVLAGGLKPGNVREATAAVRPNVVDVSSGVEISPGVKDHALMRAFAEAARG